MSLTTPGRCLDPSLGVHIASLAGFSPQDMYLAKHPLLKEPFLSMVVAQTIKRLSTVRETWVRSLGWEIPWRRKRQPTPVLLPRKIPWMEEPGVHGVAKSWTRLSDFTFTFTLWLLVYKFFTSWVSLFLSISSFFMLFRMESFS